MNRQDLYEGIGQIDDDVLERSENHRNRRRRPWWMGAVAAVLAVAVAGGIWMRPDSLLPSAYAVQEAEYPEMAPYPNEQSGSFEEEHDAWSESVWAQHQEEGYAAGLEPFFADTIRQFLSGDAGENRACSPLNLYLALGMLAEVTDGNSRQQILEALGADSIEALRMQAKAVWNAHYRDDGVTTSILANSLWMDQEISYVSSTLKTLAENYYASSYQGEMGSDSFNRALHRWIRQQTGGLLDGEGLEMKEETVLALASTLYFQARWGVEFSEDDTSPETFHGVTGDRTCDFMHTSGNGTYYWGERFGAVGRYLANDGGTMWFLLPDEGVSVEELLDDPQAMEFLLANGVWDNSRQLRVKLSLPKFDMAAQTDLRQGLESMGVTDVFDGSRSDFSPLTTDVEEIWISQARHDVRVAIDEEGVTAAACTTMIADSACAPPEEEMDFVLDRPFLFAVTSRDGLPLFAGVVHQPESTGQ